VLRISSTGSWCTGGAKEDGSPSCGGPEGIRPANAGETDVQSPDAFIGTLIGRWDLGPWFVIGNAATVTVPQGAYGLRLACNDRRLYYYDNSGEVSVLITSR
jgi:hypothetical protein